MGFFDFFKGAAEANEAQAELHNAFAQVQNRDDPYDPKTLRYLAALDKFRIATARALPDALKQVDQGSMRAAEIDTVDMLAFLEADPVFYRSGYLKEKLLTELKRRNLNRSEVERLQRVILAVVQKNDHRREFLRYCRAAANVDSARFRAALVDLEQSTEPHVSQRANWVLAALDGRWEDLKRAARGSERRGEQYYSAESPRIAR